MKIHDITQEIFSCAVFPGDFSPVRKEVMRISQGDAYNLTDFSMCTHNGTHIDAPFHFFADGKTAELISLERVIGECFVCEFEGKIGADDAEDILRNASSCMKSEVKRLLLRGSVSLTPKGAKIFADEGLFLIGVEAQSVSDEDITEVHKILLKEEVVLLEGIRLSGISEGKYFLFAPPLSLAGSDGAPCRAVLIEGY